MTIPLFRRFPALQSKLPYLPLGSLPTPVQKADRLGDYLGIKGLYLKRDDLSDPECGGSKTRKLGFLLGAAKQQGHKQLVTFGGVGSNHALATAVLGRRFDFSVLLLLAPEPPSTSLRDKLRIEKGVGAELRFVNSVSDAVAAEEQKARQTPKEQRPYLIAPGGSSTLGTIGYVNAAFELKEQIDQGLLPEPDDLYIAVGTMGSAVGLAVGLRAAGLRTRLIPIRASSRDAASEARMVELFLATVSLLRSLDASFPDMTWSAKETNLRHGYVGAGYAQPTRKGVQALSLYREYTGLELEPTYTAKAFAAVIEEANQVRDHVVLFWNTQGKASATLPRADDSVLPEAFRPFLR